MVKLGQLYLWYLIEIISCATICPQLLAYPVIVPISKGHVKALNLFQK